MKRGRKFLYNWELEEVDDDKEELQGDVVCVLCSFFAFVCNYQKVEELFKELLLNGRFGLCVISWLFWGRMNYSY